MFPFSFSSVRMTAALLAFLCLPLPLHAAPEEGAAVLVAEPAPSVALPEEVLIRADVQPAPPPPMEKRSTASRLPVLSLFSQMLDEKGAFSVEEAAGKLDGFTAYDIGPLSRETGTLWLHLDLSDVKDTAPHTLWLDLGTQTPSGVSVWLSSDGRNWQSARAETAGVYELAPAGRHGQVLVRMDGLPGLWFSPALCSLPEIMHSPERLSHVLSLAFLALLGTLCLLLSLTERGEGRFWTAVLAFAAVVQGMWGIPSTPAGSMGAASFSGMFAAGVALFMLPHAGRVLMRTRLSSPSVDLLYLLFALPGACAAIVPLLPGMAWTARLLSLWPLAAVLYLVPALLLALRGVQGAAPFFFACLSMGGAAAVSLWGLLHGLENPWWGVAVSVGQAVGLLFLSSAAPHKEGPAGAQTLEMEIPERRPVEIRANTYKENSLAALRRAFRGTVEELFDEACRLDQALTRAGLDREKVDIMTHADGMVAAARKLSESALDLPAGATLPEASLQVFELRQVIQKAFASVFEEAEKKGLGLAWYVAPQLGQKFRGDVSRLTALLSLLLADAVRASSHGAVSLHVRRSGASTHPGHLQFTVADNGEELPPRGRQSMLIARAWELASAHGGDLFIDATPQGLELTFSMECAAMESDGVTEKSVPVQEGTEMSRSEAQLVILASPDGLSRQMYAHYLDDMGFCLWEARDAEEAASLYAVSPAALVLFDGNLGEEDMVQALAAIRMFEGEQSLPAAPFLLLARDDMQAERIAKAGCDEALIQPVVRKDLRAMARWLIAPTPERPVLSTQRITLAAVLAGAHSGNARMQRKAVLKGETRREAESAPEAGGEGQSFAGHTEEGASLGAEGGQPKVLSPEEQKSPQEKKSGGWLSSLFRTYPSASSQERAQEGEPEGCEVIPSRLVREEKDAEVVELLAEDVLVEESGIQELTEADLAPASEQPETPAEGEVEELIELDSSLIHAQAEEFPPERFPDKDVPAEVSEPEDSPEDMETPSERIVERLNHISEALIQGDVQAIRGGSRELSAIADRYGMHTLADMARCFRAAWEEGDVEAAAQIVEEMRAEAARLSC